MQKNAFTTEEDYTQENFYDIVTVIIDQLITFDIIVSGFTVYDDFYDFKNNANWKNIIYKKNDIYDSGGGHAVIIVGYGVENNTYYWITQNSWDENFCDKGFFKVEFGQANIEKVFIAEAYLNDNSEGKEINIYINEVSKDCKIKFTEWRNEWFFWNVLQSKWKRILFPMRNC